MAEIGLYYASKDCLPAQLLESPAALAAYLKDFHPHLLKYTRHEDRILRLVSLLILDARVRRRSEGSRGAHVDGHANDGDDDDDDDRFVQCTRLGKPYIKSGKASFSVSHHSKHSGLCRISSSGGYVVGLDIINLNEQPKPAGCDVIDYLSYFRGHLTSSEYDYIRGQRTPGKVMESLMLAWGLKESYAKACGWGLSVDVSNFSFDLSTCYNNKKDGEGEGRENGLSLSFDSLDGTRVKHQGLVNGTRFFFVELGDEGDLAVVCAVPFSCGRRDDAVVEEGEPCRRRCADIEEEFFGTLSRGARGREGVGDITLKVVKLNKTLAFSLNNP